MSGFGTGEYKAPFLVVEQARYEFLRSVRRLCPLPLWHLRHRVAPFYFSWVDDYLSDARAGYQWSQSPEGLDAKEAMFRSFKKSGMPDDAARLAAEGRPTVGRDPDDPVFYTFALLQFQHPRLDRLLKRWARRHHLTHQREFEEQTSGRDVDEGEFVRLTLHEDFWACDWAVHTMWHWKFAPDGAALMNSDPPDWVPMPAASQAPSNESDFRIRPGWDVLIEEEDAFRDRALAALNGYIARKREHAEARGLVQPLDKRQPHHFDWLALYQVKGWGYSRIADWQQEQPGGRTVGEDAVRKGVRDAASLCGLNARPGSPGRPITRK